MALLTIKCPICGVALAMTQTGARERITNSGPVLDVSVDLTDEAKEHLRSHGPDGGGDGEPQPEPSEIILEPEGLDRVA